MRHAGFSRLSLIVGLLAIGLSCASSAPIGYEESRSQFGDALITGDQIDAQHVSNAWDLLRKMVPRYTYIEDRAGRAVAIKAHRGPSSIVLANSEAPMVIVDGVRLSSLELLQEMPTNAIDRIELRGSSRGTSSEGTNATAGVIYIHTRSAS